LSDQKQQISLGRVIHVKDGKWRVGVVIEVDEAERTFIAAVLSPREQRVDLTFHMDNGAGVDWRWPPFVAPRAA
jgi:hypothetical protein